MNVLSNVTSLAVLGSLGSMLFLGTFMGVQAVLDAARRRRFALFAAVCGAIATLDLLHSRLPVEDYERMRMLAWHWYAASLLWLLGWRWHWAMLAAVALPSVGNLLWVSGFQELATTLTFPVALGVVAVAHGRIYLRTRGYASCVLTAYSAAMALLCGAYYAVVKTADTRVIGLGYVHWGFLSVLAVLFGWIHLPRELKGRSPVTIPLAQGGLFIALIVAAELGVMAGLLSFFDWPPVVYLLATLLMCSATLALYFHHRHRLVIYADNVTVLLDERTASLRKAREELSAQNEIQGRKLEEQAREINAKALIIDRQRRLELAAQTAGQAAHDIQNLISPMLAHVDQLDQETSPNAQRAARKIRAQLEHLLELNAQMLALSRRGRRDLHPLCLNELLADLADRFPGKRLVIEGRAPVWIEGAWSQLSRALANLVTNALEAMPEGGGVTVRCGVTENAETRRCHLGFLAPGRHAFVEVEDAGSGIPENIREQIFEPFFSTKEGRHRSGSGLGLSIVTAVVDDHRGVLDLRTSLSGTCFTLFFPVMASPMEPPDPARLCGKETVLVIDDDNEIREKWTRILEEAGYRALAAGDGLEALKVLQDRSVDLMLLDLKMPRMGGFETFLSALHIRPGIQGIVHSSFVSPEEANRLKSLGIFDLLPKDAGRLEVLRAVRQALDSRSSSASIPPARVVYPQSI